MRVVKMGNNRYALPSYTIINVFLDTPGTLKGLLRAINFKKPVTAFRAGGVSLIICKNILFCFITPPCIHSRSDTVVTLEHEDGTRVAL
jgi:hypothetical protein